MTRIYWIIEWIKGVIPMYYCGDLDWSFHRTKAYEYDDKKTADRICSEFNKRLEGYCMVTEVIVNDN
jgi:hypothetical protein